MHPKLNYRKEKKPKMNSQAKFKSSQCNAKMTPAHDVTLNQTEAK